MEIHLVGTELFQVYGERDRQTDSQTDMTELVVTFGNFAKAPKNVSAVVSSNAYMIAV